MSASKQLLLWHHHADKWDKTPIHGADYCLSYVLFLSFPEVVLSVLLETFKFSISGTERDVVWNMAFVVYPSTVGKDSSSSGTDAQGIGTPHASLPLRVERCVDGQ
ncbi:hypothetical protein PHLCEN_2v10853 [Hermanssonia centrifuga]|uniref:Uncharacterized protein n=1 Tax=Hermanssonia centrifuga TaxID=98765 RepID=A0A2R6NLQ8_9APHY|nr:hypothetical protein PHLCEN_2v10853 [Hermanssonia centrifuga]